MILIHIHYVSREQKESNITEYNMAYCHIHCILYYTDILNTYIMDLDIHKNYRSAGKFHHRVPTKTGSTATKLDTCKEISKYIEKNNDFGSINYLANESSIIKKLDPYTTYVYEDLY